MAQVSISMFQILFCLCFQKGTVYALRVNLSVAIVAMTENYTIIINGTAVQVNFQFSIR